MLRPYRGLGAIQQNWGIGHNTYHSIQTSVNRRFRNGFSLGLNYTLGLSNTGDAGNPVRLEHHSDGSFSIRADQATQDELMKDLGLQRHIIKGNMVWDLPKMSTGSGARNVLAAIVNDWQLSGILTAGTGAPYSVTTLQVTSPLNLTPSNPQYDASGSLVQTRLTPQNAGFGAANGAQNMRSMQMQIRFQF